VSEVDKPLLSAEETAAVERMLSAAWGDAQQLVGVEPVQGRSHAAVLSTRSGGRAFLKRPRAPRANERDSDGFAAEWSALEFFSTNDDVPTPKLIAADFDCRLLITELLPAGRSLAELLLAGERAAASTALVSYAEALARAHLAGLAGLERYAAIVATSGLGPRHRCGWDHVAGTDSQAGFLSLAGDLGAGMAGLATELLVMRERLFSGRLVALIHGDPCPDNVRVIDGRCTIFDFEMAGLGSLALDAAYLQAPFPSCWCFGLLPPDIAQAATGVYEDVLEKAGVRLDGEWDASVAAALACWVVGRWRLLRDVIDDDRDWGTTTIRPRLLVWLAAAAEACQEPFPMLAATCHQLRQTLGQKWHEPAVPLFPSLRGDEPIGGLPAW
jgi:Phosphotransferase enzyme family